MSTGVAVLFCVWGFAVAAAVSKKVSGCGLLIALCVAVLATACVMIGGK